MRAEALLKDATNKLDELLVIRIKGKKYEYKEPKYPTPESEEPEQEEPAKHEELEVLTKMNREEHKYKQERRQPTYGYTGYSWVQNREDYSNLLG